MLERDYMLDLVSHELGSLDFTVAHFVSYMPPASNTHIQTLHSNFCSLILERLL